MVHRPSHRGSLSPGHCRRRIRPRLASDHRGRGRGAGGAGGSRPTHPLPPDRECRHCHRAGALQGPGATDHDGHRCESQADLVLVAANGLPGDPVPHDKGRLRGQRGSRPVHDLECRDRPSIGASRSRPQLPTTGGKRVEHTLRALCLNPFGYARRCVTRAADLDARGRRNGTYRPVPTELEPEAS